MKTNRKLLKIEDCNKKCGNCYNYTSATNYWNSLYIANEKR